MSKIKLTTRNTKGLPEMEALSITGIRSLAQSPQLNCSVKNLLRHQHADITVPKTIFCLVCILRAQRDF
jgi:hypothetical protein